MDKTVFVFDLNAVLPEEREEEIRAKLAAQIESGVILLGDEVTFVEAFGAPEGAPVVVFDREAADKPAEWADPGACKLTRRRESAISYAELKAAIKSGRGPEVIRPFDELEIVLEDGYVITAVCGGYVTPTRARFVFKDCLPETHSMNTTATNKGGYLNSTGRRHVLEDILPRLPKELRDVIEPRRMVEEIDGELHEYADTLWLPSGNDVFGVDEWWNNEPDSPQLEIFKSERGRVKERDGYGTCSWWLRSPGASSSNIFVNVYADGTVSVNTANFSLGFAPGFDM